MLRIDRGCFVTVVDSELTVDNDEDARTMSSERA